MVKNLITIETKKKSLVMAFCYVFLPYTSPQNGKAERALRTINDIIRTLLIHSSMPPKYWAEALRTATYLLNIRPTKSNPHNTPYFSLFCCYPDYSEQHVFGWLCFPNMYATSLMTHKYRGSQQSSREVLPKFIDSTQGEPKNICKP
jgi:hypothetical protein